MGFVDSAMDRLVVPGYSKLGYAVRQRGWSELPRLDGKVVLVTGASAGIGKATAAGLARLGAEVHLVVRNRERGETAAREIGGGVVDVCDVSDLDSIRAYEAPAKIHALIHNAGVLPPERTTTPQGNETAFATHVLGPHLLTKRLLPALTGGVVIFMTSGGMYAQKLDTSDLQYERGEFSGTKAYARTKRMQVVLAQLWAERTTETAFASTHPGWADTPGLAESLTRFRKLTGPILRDTDQGADTAIWLAATDAARQHPGALWHDRATRPKHYVPWTRETSQDRVSLWRAVDQLTQ